MRIFKTKWFTRFARKEGISANTLLAASKEVESGNFDADLGGGVYKQRVARPGEGKSGGYRTILCYKAGERIFFLYGFPKSAKDNIAQDEEKTFKKLARHLNEMPEAAIEGMLKTGDLEEIQYEEG